MIAFIKRFFSRKYQTVEIQSGWWDKKDSNMNPKDMLEFSEYLKEQSVYWEKMAWEQLEVDQSGKPPVEAFESPF